MRVKKTIAFLAILMMACNGLSAFGTTAPTPVATWTRPVDGMVMVLVAEGEFTMGSLSFEASKPVHKLTLGEYWIDQTEVTNDMFGLFVQASGYQTESEKNGAAYIYTAAGMQETPGADWQHPTGFGSDITGLGEHPVVQVSWNDARAYCQWAGARLPTEAEWEKAARGTEASTYPWGEQTADGSLANFADVNYPSDYADKNSDDGFMYTAAVGTYPAGASPYGALDMAGNAWEWVADWYEAYPGQEASAESYFGQTFRVMRGGSYRMNGTAIRTTYRWAAIPGYAAEDLGFRCARSDSDVNTATEPTSLPSPSATPTPFVIEAAPFPFSTQACSLDVNIISSTDDNLIVSFNQDFTMTDSMEVFCNGAKHTWIGTLVYMGFIFTSDDESPLQFRVVNNRYVYIQGRGAVTLPDGTVVTLPE